MKKYAYHQKLGKIIQKQTGKEEDWIYLMCLEEFMNCVEKLPRKNNFLQSMKSIQYCKLEKYKECIQGTMRVPKGNRQQVCIYEFGFYLLEHELYFVGENEFVGKILDKMAQTDYENNNLRQILLVVFEQLLQDEVLYLQNQEEQLAKLEEQLLEKIPDFFYEIIMKYRKRLNLFHAYYEQLMNLSDVMQTFAGGGLSEEERTAWQLFSSRLQRLHDHVEMLREYLVQIRDLYQSLIAVQQNEVISILTVVTTIFLPLTLIAGWYGMNFPNMPEFHWKYAYQAVIIVSVAVILLEVIYFKKKKMF